MPHCYGTVMNNYCGLVNVCISISKKEEDVEKMNSPAILYAKEESYSIICVI